MLFVKFATFSTNFFLKLFSFADFSLSLWRLGGEIPSRRCISFYFALYRRRLRNFLWNSSNEEAREKPKEGYSSLRASAMHHALAWQHSYIVVRGSISEARPLGKVHKSGHAILYAFPFAYSFYY
jgi:hypothetical protein